MAMPPRNAVRNILKVWGEATPEDRVMGAEWYPMAGMAVRGIAACYERPVEEVAGIVAVLSPRMRWAYNLRAAMCVLDDQPKPTDVMGTTWCKACVIRERILPPSAVLGGPKVWAFYQNLRTGGQHPWPVIDMHAAGVASGRLLERGTQIKPREYGAWARAYVRAAEKIGRPVSEVQATTWIVWRREYWTRQPKGA